LGLSKQYEALGSGGAGRGSGTNKQENRAMEREGTPGKTLIDAVVKEEGSRFGVQDEPRKIQEKPAIFSTGGGETRRCERICKVERGRTGAGGDAKKEKPDYSSGCKLRTRTKFLSEGRLFL